MLKLFLSFISNTSKILGLIMQGVNLTSPFAVDIRGELKVGNNVFIGRNVTFKGEVTLEDDVVIEEACTLDSCHISKSSHVKSSSIVEGSIIGKGTFVGPFARLRGNSLVGENCQIGNFVEIKNSTINSGCRINHMAFIGDTVMGKDVTIGAGVITCNHDGKRTQKTTISNGAYIGSNSNLIAPLKIGLNVTIGSGSTIDKDIGDNELAIARSKQVIISDWVKKN